MKTLLFLLIFGHVSSLINGQDFCYTTTIETSGTSRQALNITNHPAYYLRVFTQVIRKSDGTGGQSFNDIQITLSNLNMDFNRYDIYFVWDECIKYIDSDYYYYYYTDDENILDELFSLDNHSYGIDIYALHDDHIIKGGSGSI